MIEDATNGMEGLELFKNNKDKINAVLLDLVMPKKSGIDALKEIVAINPDEKILLTSGYLQDKRIEEAQKYNVKHFIQKSYTYMKLARAMYELLHK